MSSTRIELLGSPIDAVSLADAVTAAEKAVEARSPTLHASLNAAKLVRAREDEELNEALRACDLVTADGQPVVWAARLLGRPLPARVAGIDLMMALLEHAEKQAWTVYFLGARRDVLIDAVAEVRRRHPRIRVAGSRDGYFATNEEHDLVSAIASTKPDLLFVALGTPQKELFQVRHRQALGASFVMGVGGAFEVLAGRRRRAPAWAQRIGLEWAFRLAQEPVRLFRRYLVGNVRFVALVARELIGGVR